jgi:eukaryotic-like serine/threonine-protein kinase
MPYEPSEATQATITRLLSNLEHGSRDALDALLPLIYDELRSLAHWQRLRWRGAHTLGTTALLHEAYLKLVNQRRIAVKDRAHFFALASRAMRHILCNYARDRHAKKRGGAFDLVELDSSVDVASGDPTSRDGAAERLLALDAALARLEEVHPRRSRVVECRFFGGMTVENTAAALGIAPRTVKRDWAAAQDWLRREIIRVEQGEGAPQTLDELAADALPPLLEAFALADRSELPAGERVGQYEIVATVGRGGMGVVYKAYDARLDRHVALKFLPSPLAADAAARARLMNEARAASALDHPNICTVYDIGELDDGRVYLALAYYEGETLEAKGRGGPLAVDEAVAITRQIAQALRAAHRRGIVHRDIKPSNVMITDEGMVKILDFGIAKLREGDMPAEAAAMGTLPYMSPEQTTGAGADARADLWSLGVVMYEMLTGRLPFEGADPQRLVHAIRHEPFAPAAARRPSLPPPVVRIIETCLRKDPAARYQDAAEVLAELSAFGGPAAAAPVPARRVAIVPLGSALSVAEDGYLADGIAEDLITRLSGLSGLHIIARGSALALRERHEAAAQIGAELGADTIVRVAASRSGEDLGIGAEVVDVARGEPVWRTELEVSLSELETAVRTLAWQITSELAVQVHGDEGRQLARSGTESGAAYALYLKGRYFWNKRDRTNIQQARDNFQQALDLDPVFPQAWAGLADTFTVLGGYLLLQPEEAYPRARAAAEQALALDDGLAEAHASLATVLADFYWDWRAAGQHYRRALVLNPGYATARLWYAGFLRDLGQFEEALVQVRTARDLDPLSLPVQAAEGITLYVARRYPEAVAVYRKLLGITPSFTYAYFLLALALTQQRNYAEALACLQKAEEWGGAIADVRALTGYVHTALARPAEARRMLEALDDPLSPQHATPFHRAYVHLGLGETDRALQLLEQARDARAKQVRLLRVEPAFDPIRGEPRFRALLESVGLTDDAVARALAP